MTTARLSDLVDFRNRSLASRYARRIPMATLLESYIDGDIDIPDIDALLDARDEVLTFDLTAEHVKFFVTRMIPEWLVHSQAQDKRIVRDHYDRGDDFFEAFLGDSMIYTGAYFQDESESLETAQRNKMNRIGEKLGIRPEHEVLDIGCGWGTLVAHSAKQFGAKATGITISERGAKFGNDRIAKAGVSERARIECLDYRDIPKRSYDRIVSLEMVEHVGIKNLPKYFSIVYDRLADDGLFLLQWCGLRRGGREGVPPVGMRPEDMIWGLFMNKYIFSGADASLPPSEMLKAMEKAGFELHSVENVSVHYQLTIQRWHDNWRKNRELVLGRYGERWYRLWNLFLAWSWRIAAQGTSACFQIVAHKNLDGFDRRRMALPVEAALAAE
ncbi:Cyclopropane-fatty-acyl-phospholipid synthase [Labilithrix luteola]|uniref:sphingolipid C(9)-methyltransferase n=2 Tax=Labilithrix luteola TaxID=1391654 RepID=A0A0K1Q008_9BACT|nr:Cyclopropane-fatty-acyl-phospholipid synthase [Labilithrix luteola]